MNPRLDPDTRARLILKEMSFDEKLALVHGIDAWPDAPGSHPAAALHSAGYIAGNQRLGIPAIQETDASLGVAGVMPGDVATALPSGAALAATWDPEVAYRGGSMIGREAWSRGFNVMLAGGVNLTREPRNGRNFEYLGEDPLLAGLLDGASVRGIQDQHVVSTVKHFAFNSQETGRNYRMNARVGEAAGRESDLLAFELAIESGRPGSIMCAYNSINGAAACSNDYLLNKVLKGDWGYPGWVMSDWGAVPDEKAALNGLDQQSGEQDDKKPWFNEPLRAAIKAGTISEARLDDMAQRILRSLIAVGGLEHPPVRTAVDYAQDAKVAREQAEAGIVLLANRHQALPLAGSLKKVAIIGAFADKGVIAGGGSTFVRAEGGPPGYAYINFDGLVEYHPSSPLAAIKQKLPNSSVTFYDGSYPLGAAQAAKDADVAIVFAHQWTAEGHDVPDLSLPNGQDAMIAAVAKANPHTIVVLQTGGPVLMPWIHDVSAVVEAWYSGGRGGEAITDVLFGDVNPSGHLPYTFPASEAQLPQRALPGVDAGDTASFDVKYAEGADVGYRWYARQNLKPLFPFGFGLSYTSFEYKDLKAAGGKALHISFDVKNTGARKGADVPQVYLVSRLGKPIRRLVGWSKLSIEPGQAGKVDLTVDPRMLADFNPQSHRWEVPAGDYEIAVSTSAEHPVLRAHVALDAATIKP
jgi:beta-glucosidase